MDRHDHSGVVHDLDVLADPDRLAVFADGWKFEICVRRAVRQLRRVHRAGLLAIVRADEREEMAAEQLVIAVLHHPGGSRVHVGEVPARIAVVDQVLRVFDDVPEPLLTRAERFFGMMPRRDVAIVHDDRAHRGFVETVHRDRFDEPPRSVLVLVPEFGGDGHPRFPQALAECRAHGSLVVRVHHVPGALAEAFFDGVAKQAPRCLADEGDLSHLIEEDDGIGAVRDQRVKQLAGWVWGVHHQWMWRLGDLAIS